MTSPRTVAILGSTGSIGRQAIDVVLANPDRFRVVALAAGGANVELLAAQALRLGVATVGISRATATEDLLLALYAAASERGYATGEFALPRIVTGPDAATEIASSPCDIVLNGITGSIGLAPTLAALDAGRTLALANKESLIVGGALVLDRAKPGQLVPVDSEHSALAQALRGGRREEVARLVVTASGGPFRGKTRAELAAVTVDDALAHPTWDMGPVITINSATLVNKGLEVIEAHLLFDVPYDDIAVVVHPQSVVHSMVEFTDGSTLAQASPPDMRLPIALALGWPERVPGAAEAVDWSTASSWTFEPLDDEAFPAVGLAKAAGRTGGVLPAIYNAANEEAVQAFRTGTLPFLGIVDTIAQVLDEAAHHDELGNGSTLDGVLAAEQWARDRARQVMTGQVRTGQVMSGQARSGPAGRGS